MSAEEINQGQFILSYILELIKENCHAQELEDPLRQAVKYIYLHAEKKYCHDMIQKMLQGLIKKLGGNKHYILIYKKFVNALAELYRQLIMQDLPEITGFLMRTLEQTPQWREVIANQVAVQKENNIVAKVFESLRFSDRMKYKYEFNQAFPVALAVDNVQFFMSYMKVYGSINPSKILISAQFSSNKCFDYLLSYTPNFEEAFIEKITETIKIKD